jgi:hypothetical protein
MKYLEPLRIEISPPNCCCCKNLSLLLYTFYIVLLLHNTQPTTHAHITHTQQREERTAHNLNNKALSDDKKLKQLSLSIMPNSDELTEPCLSDIESGPAIDDDNDLTDFSSSDDLPTHTPSLTMSRSEPLPNRSNSDRSNSLSIPSRTRCSTNPELSTTPEHHPNHSLLLTAFTAYLDVAVPFLRRGTSTGSSPPVPLFLCAICLENHGVEDSFSLQSCTPHHTFCKESMGMFLSSQISDGAVTSLKCPCYGQDECNGIFSKDEVRALVDEPCYEQFSRLLEIKTNPNARECPSCSKFSTTGSEDSPEITCEDCRTSFCYLHNNAHPSMSCQEYVRRTAKTDMRSIATIKATSRKCPQCKAPTQKISGCNHMTCQHCHEDWCWLCGRHMEDSHYDGFSPCSGQQFGVASPFALWNFFPCLLV